MWETMGELVPQGLTEQQDRMVSSVPLVRPETRASQDHKDQGAILVCLDLRVRMVCQV